MDVAGAAMQTFVKKVVATTCIKMVNVAAFTLFSYDYLLTLGMEVKHVWPGAWTPVKIVYLLQRYLPFIDTLLLEAQISFAQNLTLKTCTILSNVGRSMVFVGLASSEILLAIRVWAVWNKNELLSIFLPVAFAACFLPHIPILYFFLTSIQFGVAPWPLFGCFAVSANPIIFVNFVLLLVWDTLVLILMLIPAYKAYHDRGYSALYHIIYSQGKPS
ncbi:unnamed protein product [Cyclocybe aegerita]|uniref:DUF6533 domain-containing protein n=1 Tax=Cyclocybe aegerita TaxID=1973307 RepID=A0A8S0VZK1_CYCAE|nr:unnamed protein product [Cyclocybe aegerita]